MGEVLIVLHRVDHREVYCTAALGSERGKGKMGTKRTGLHKGGQLCEGASVPLSLDYNHSCYESGPLNIRFQLCDNC